MMIESFFLLPVLLAAATAPLPTAATTTVEASPPACLLAVLSKQSTPCKIAEICKDSQDRVLAAIENVCLPDRVEPARQAFASACSARGVDVTATPTAAGGDGGSSGGGIHAPGPEVLLYAVVGAWAASAVISIYLV
ncbi:hypothetical protein D7B24_005582 [Verticillium nonalfalfae]|uniref:Extracellular membrane protein CFEM domain-containing protein n=1 Tax=Verticillium nonalfalfae TaxID=1051616 RepID=A0A3M9YBF5_9PEZI|nr:uncharacterized protein D7B24_005582 [Verticillium nonalfalfae]RNJ57789.1 hypothetical protein D7B24_005582 [Verticillium nonalfalfae]